MELPAVDRLAAEHLTQGPGDPAYFFIAYLLATARAGHLCSIIDSESLFPPLPLVWENEPWEDKKEFHFSQKIQNALFKLPSGIVGDSPLLPIHAFQNRFYLRRCWEDETRVLKGLASLLSFTPDVAVDSKKAQASVDRLPLEKEQKQGILGGLEHSLSLLLGGPGTGKTYTAGLFLQTLWETLPQDRKKNFRIALAAPTGKAAARLQKSFIEKTSTLGDFPPLQATTLHALLKGSSNPCFCLEEDLLLIDECSMIDAEMLGKLLTSVKKGARLLMLGDPYQLPPVGSGQLFKDIASLLLDDPSEKSRVAELKKCQRTDLKGILDIAESVREGNSEKTCELALASEGVEVRFFPEDASESRIKSALYEKDNDGFHLLTPLRRGPLGVDALNTALRDRHFSAARPPFSLPITIRENDPALELFNGETGLLIQTDRFPKKEDKAHFHFPVKRSIPLALLPRYEYAFALSVHKSQGSEFEKVRLILPQGSPLFGREMLYTGITRAKKQLEIWCRKETLIKTVEKSGNRFSSLKERYFDDKRRKTG